jgi:hypothetical protein
MKKPFAVFWSDESGPAWIDAVDTIEIAKTALKVSGRYAVLYQRTGIFPFSPSAGWCEHFPAEP